MGPGLREFWTGQVDLAPLGLFRIVYGVLLIVWLLQLGPDLRVFFTDEGLLPRHAMSPSQTSRFSVLHLVGEWWQVAVIWALSLLVAGLLTVGYGTRLACLLTFLAVASFEHRNPLIWAGPDAVFRVIAFWLIFTAAGDRFSVDAALRRARGERLTGRGPAFPVRLLQLQVAWIYLATGLEKLAGRTWLDGTAVHYPLQHGFFGRAHARALAQVEWLMRAATWGTLVVEFGFLPAAFLPFFQPAARLLAVVGAAMLQVGILLLMNVGNFPLIMLATLILFLPPPLVHRTIRLARHLLPRPGVRMYYDGACSRCQRTTAFVRALDIYATVEYVDIRTFGPEKTEVPTAALEKHIQVADRQGRVYRGFAAYARAGRAIPLLIPLATVGVIPVLSHLVERVYDRLVGHCSHLTGGLEQPGEREATRAQPAARRTIWNPRLARCPFWRPVSLTALGLLAAAAFATAIPDNVRSGGLPAPIGAITRFIGVAQNWDMFGLQTGRLIEAWMLAPGKLADGTPVDLIDEWGDPQPRHPRALSGPVAPGPRFPPVYTRWFKIHRRLVDSRGYLREYARMYCRLRNLHLGPGQSPLRTFDLIWMRRTVPPPGRAQPAIREEHLGSYRC